MENRIKEARTRKHISQAGLAELVGVGVPQVSRWESGKVDIPLSRVRQIAAALGVSISELIGFDDFKYAHERPLADPALLGGNAVAIPLEGASEERMREDLPIYGTALGAPRVVEGEAVEQTMLNTGDIIQYVKRPVILNGRADAYGLYVQGQSMEPVHMEGDFALAETKRPARVGDDVVVYLRPKTDEDDGERARSVLLKRLIRRTSSYIELEQFNPHISFRLSSEDVLRIDRVMRLADLIG